MFTSYELYKLVKGYDDLGLAIEEWQSLGYIEAILSTNTLTTAQGNVVYNAYEIVGLCKAELEPNVDYKLVNNEHEYKVVSFIPSHNFTTLRLEEILC